MSLYLHKALSTASKPILFLSTDQEFLFLLVSPSPCLFLCPWSQCALTVAALWCSPVFPKHSTSLCYQSPTAAASPAPLTLGSQESLSPRPPAQKEGACTSLGELPHCPVHVCTLSLSQIQTRARTPYISTLPHNTLVFTNGKPGKMRGCGGAT